VEIHQIKDPTCMLNLLQVVNEIPHGTDFDEY